MHGSERERAPNRKPTQPRGETKYTPVTVIHLQPDAHCWAWNTFKTIPGGRTGSGGSFLVKQCPEKLFLWSHRQRKSFLKHKSLYSYDSHLPAAGPTRGAQNQPSKASKQEDPLSPGAGGPGAPEREDKDIIVQRDRSGAHLTAAPPITPHLCCSSGILRLPSGWRRGQRSGGREQLLEDRWRVSWGEGPRNNVSESDKGWTSPVWSCQSVSWPSASLTHCFIKRWFMYQSLTFGWLVILM